MLLVWSARVQTPTSQEKIATDNILFTNFEVVSLPVGIPVWEQRYILLLEPRDWKTVSIQILNKYIILVLLTPFIRSVLLLLAPL